MNRYFLIIALAGLLFSCSTEQVSDNHPNPTKELAEEKLAEEERLNADKIYLFESDDEGVKEFMRCTQKADGSREWVYFTAKNEKEISLGTREQAGFEVVYFQGKPKELYWVYGAECGFTLSDETRKTSQWYGQVQPRCSDDMFE